ncbi:MAG: hypothetical protein ABIR19_01795, partial [Ginsengibacter sp.]
YSHHVVSHKWYPYEIRIIRNDADIHSWRDAQSFRRIPGFNDIDYFQKENTFKLKVAKVDASVFHYGWVRPPELMKKKWVLFETHMQGEQKAQSFFKQKPEVFDYGDMRRLAVFKETHPAVMRDFINKFNWQNQLYPHNKTISKHKHDKLKYRVLSYLEQKILGGKQIGGFKNYELIKTPE